MSDRSSGRPDLRASIPTLEPDDAFVARLSALAAAGAPAPATPARPIGMWRISFAAVGVAAVLVGVAWVAGLNPTQSPSPAPAPATTPSAPDHSPAPPPSPTVRTTAGEAGPLASPETEVAASTTSTPGKSPVREDDGSPASSDHQTGTTGASNSADSSGSQSQGKDEEKPDRGHGPNAHAGDHPNEHSTTKSNNANEHPGTPPDRGKGGSSGR